MKHVIEGWGIPSIEELKHKDIRFVFDSKLLKNPSEYYMNLKCEQNNVKFCLYNFDTKTIAFSMDFFESNNAILRANGELAYLKLELLNVNDSELRNKGIASFYLRKLQEYAIENKFSYIKVNPCPNANIFKEQSKDNSLNITDLKDFYRRKSLKEMPIKLFSE